MLPFMSDLTGVKATEPRRSKRVVVDSAAERKSRVEMPLSVGSIGTLEKCVLRVSNQVLPEGI